ncbi:MAG: hypothetical protein AAB420_02350 [Patescibacteria group bacterium]
MEPLVSINLVFHKDKSFFKPQLDSIEAQTYKNREVNIFDGQQNNIGFWAGQEKLLEKSNGKYIICMSDVILDKNFVNKAVEIMEKDEAIGALQAKILQSDGLIDTTGFEIFRSRKILNRGKQTRNEYPEGEIFAVEGAVPIFRREAIEDCKIEGHIIDPDYRIGPFGYGDDLDLAWRMRLFGWKQWYAPSVIGYHDRSTSIARDKIPLIKRQLDWCNVRFTLIKNEYIINILKDLPFWLVREIGVMVYTLLLEPRVFAIYPRFFSLLSCMLRRRKLIMKKAKISARDLRSLYT